MKQSRKRSNIVPITKDPRATNVLKYRSEFCKLVTELARQGHFPEEWCAQIEVSLSTMYNWANRYPAFDDACQLAWTYLTAYWTRQALQAACGGPADAKLLIHILQKRFPDTWGHKACNTQASFPMGTKGQKQEPAKPSANSLDEMTISELRAEIQRAGSRT
ncbi:hypothetical protein [Pacificibacter maritimus]|nr:hypothetical protein [Pacificibacter maritimus]